MWYGGYDGSHIRIHYATSSDGISWDKQGVVVPLGASGDSDDVHTYAPSVILDNGTYKMWYGGYDGSHIRIHYATIDMLNINIPMEGGNVLKDVTMFDNNIVDGNTDIFGAKNKNGMIDFKTEFFIEK